jgi:hypothetical protein
MSNATVCSIDLGSAKPDGSVSETKGFRISRNSDEIIKMTTTILDDWRIPWYII